MEMLRLFEWAEDDRDDKRMELVDPTLSTSFFTIIVNERTQHI